MKASEYKSWLDIVKEKDKRKNQILFTRDSKCLQELLVCIQNQKHRTLVMWAFLCVKNTLEILDAHYPDDERPRKAVVLCKQWAEGDVKMPMAKKALLAAHGMAKEIESLEDIALCHAVGHACATVHVETHAIGLPMYELTAIVRKYGIENCESHVERRIEEYITCLKTCEKEINAYQGKWAAFLLDDTRQNKEKLLVQKKTISNNN